MMKVRVTSIAEGPQGPPMPGPQPDAPPPSFLVSFIRVAEPSVTAPLGTFQLHLESVDGLAVSSEYTLNLTPAE